MQIECSNCGRSFQIDDQRAAGVPAAKCLCGARLYLQPESRDALPRRLGKYVLMSRIAVGGMGEIYYGKLAGVEGFEREVAIKKMLQHLSADRDFINMMVKEAKLTVLLNHPNIVQVYDLAKDGEEYYIAMEYVPGATVGTILEQARSSGFQLPVEVAAHITSQILRGLAYAHDLPGPDGERFSILHRDITPQNILVTRDAWVKITDFGIAKALNEITTTNPGMIKGKLGYIAPEQLDGQAPDQRVDIFCAGILLWEMLAVRRLFKGATEVDTFRLISECNIPSLAQYRSDVSSDLDAVIVKALARDRDQRFGRADDFYNALNAAIFPKTFDDFRNGTRSFFTEHADIFRTAENPRTEAAALSSGPIDTTQLMASGSDPGTNSLTDISTLLVHRHQSNATLIATIIAAALLVILAGAWLFRGQIFGVPAGSSSSAQGAAEQGGPRDLRSPTPPLTAAELQLGVDREHVRLTECYRQMPKGARRVDRVSARLAVDSAGAVATVTVQPGRDPLGDRAVQCLEDVLRALRFRAHPTSSFEATVNLPVPPAPSADDSSSSEPAAASPKGASAAGPKPSEKLTGAEIQSVVQRYSSTILGCLQGFERASAPSKVDARITIDVSGKVTAAEFSPELENDAVAQCLQKTLRSMKFRRHPTKGFRVTIPLKFQVL